MLGLAGAVLSGVGDVLILGRTCSGREFDDATGRIPPNIDADPRWRSLWNGASFAPGRLHVGTVIGVVGIGVLQCGGTEAAARSVPPGRFRRLATVSAAGFALSGVLTHLGCGTVIRAYRRSAERTPDAPDRRQLVAAIRHDDAGGERARRPRHAGRLQRGRDRGGRARSGPDAEGRAVVTPFPCVLATLLTFGCCLPRSGGTSARRR